MKRGLLEDAGDRAERYRSTGECRILLKKIAFWDSNRGGIGASGHHVHEVAHDIVTNKTKLNRYSHCKLVKIPDESLSRIREANKLKCQHDALMPQFSDDITYVCVTKTHFIHALKLVKDGGRKLFDKLTPIVLKDDDTEGAMIMEHGPVCQIYTQGLLQDKDAITALASDDNLNAVVQWSEDEMQSFGRGSDMFERLTNTSGQTTIEKLIANLQTVGMGQFTREDWTDFLSLRVSLPLQHAIVLQHCQFNACAGRVRVRPCDFGQAALLDARAPWAKIAIMLCQYISMLDDKADSISAYTFSGRKEIFAPKLKKPVVHELVVEQEFVRNMSTFINEMCILYASPTQGSPNQVNDLLTARGEWLSHCGRYLLKIGGILEHATREASSRRDVLQPEERIRLLEKEHLGKFNKLETIFRSDLVKKNLFADDTLPPSTYPEVQAPVDKGAGPYTRGHETKAMKDAPVAAICATDELVLADMQNITESQCLNRLGVKACGEQVLALWREPFYVTGVKIEPGEQSSGEGKWLTVELVSISVPDAVVELVTKRPQSDSLPESVVRIARTMPVDDLRPLVTVRQPPVILHPSLRAPGTTLGTYCYDADKLAYEKAMVEHMIVWTHSCSIKSVEGVTVSFIGDPKKQQFILQVRADIPFKKGTLVLAPMTTELVRTHSDDGRALVNTTIAEKQKKIHESMLSYVELGVSTGTDFRKQVHDAHGSGWLIRSPLMTGKNKHTPTDDGPLTNVAPFWGLLRCCGPIAIHNMELEIMHFRDSGFEPRATGLPKMQKGMANLVGLPIARNIDHVSKGDILCLPFE